MNHKCIYDNVVLAKTGNKHTYILKSPFSNGRHLREQAASILMFAAMREFAEHFYKSKAWQACRIGYVKSVGGLCEECLRNGRYTAGVIVHHKIHLTPENINRPEITMDWNNLELLCRNCHAQIHDARKRRYKIDEFGRVITA